MSDPVNSPAPVGQLLASEIESHEWTQAEFAAVLGRPVQFVSEIINGRKEITRESAAQIGAALGQTPEFWLAFQDQYLLSEHVKSARTQQSLSDVRRRARLNHKVPVAALRKRGVLTKTRLDELEAEVVELLELSSIDDEPTFSIAARRSNNDEPVSLAQTAWVACVRRQARSVAPTSQYSKARMTSLARELPRLLQTPEDFAHLPARFVAVGVALVYVQALPGAKIDGCSFMLGDIPVIAISGRGKRLDKVLWTLLHEVAHVVLGHLTAEVLVDALDDPAYDSDAEITADRQATGWLLPDPLPRVPGRLGGAWIDRVAAERGLAPIVVVGQLQKSGLLDWRTTFARDAPSVVSALEMW